MKDQPSKARAYREAGIMLEIGEDLAWDVAVFAVEESGIAKRRRKDRREWIDNCKCLLEGAGVEFACVAADGRPTRQCMVNEELIRYVERKDSGGLRAKVTPKGVEMIALDSGPIGEAWRFSPVACRKFLCLLATRLRLFYEKHSHFRRWDIIASDEMARLERPGRLPLLTENELSSQLERIGVVTKIIKGDQHSLLAQDRKHIRDSGLEELQRDSRPLHNGQARKGVQSER